MMFRNVDKIQSYERQIFHVLKQVVENSPYLNNTQKDCIERKLQEVVDIWVNPDFVNESEGVK